MKCIVMSDSHGAYMNIQMVLASHRDCDVVFFLGDGCAELESVSHDFPEKMFIAVRGNCDVTMVFRNSMLQKTEEISLMGHKILLTHGDLFGAKSGTYALSALSASRGADVILFGHTHVPCDKYVGGEHPHYLFNPGSIRDGSFGILTLDEMVSFAVCRLV